MNLSHPTYAPIIALKLKLGFLTLLFLHKAKLLLFTGALERTARFKHHTLFFLTLFLLVNLPGTAELETQALHQAQI